MSHFFTRLAEINKANNRPPRKRFRDSLIAVGCLHCRQHWWAPIHRDAQTEGYHAYQRPRDANIAA